MEGASKDRGKTQFVRRNSRKVFNSRKHNKAEKQKQRKNQEKRKHQVNSRKNMCIKNWQLKKNLKFTRFLKTKYKNRDQMSNFSRGKGLLSCLKKKKIKNNKKLKTPSKVPIPTTGEDCSKLTIPYTANNTDSFKELTENYWLLMRLKKLA